MDVTSEEDRLKAFLTAAIVSLGGISAFVAG